MQKLNELLAQQQAIAAQLAQLTSNADERAAVIADIKSKVQLFGFKYAEFSDVLKAERKKKAK